MGFDQNFGFNLAAVVGDLATANGVRPVTQGGTDSYTRAPGKKFKLRRVMGECSGVFIINKWDGTTLTPLTQTLQGGNNIEIPGLDLETGENEEFRFSGGTDASPELNVQIAVVNLIRGSQQL